MVRVCREPSGGGDEASCMVGRGNRKDGGRWSKKRLLLVKLLDSEDEDTSNQEEEASTSEALRLISTPSTSKHRRSPCEMSPDTSVTVLEESKVALVLSTGEPGRKLKSSMYGSARGEGRGGKGFISIISDTMSTVEGAGRRAFSVASSFSGTKDELVGTLWPCEQHRRGGKPSSPR